MSDLKLDGRSWKFLVNPANHIGNSDLKLEPLKRQFTTAREILRRFQQGRGVLLADDVGLGKTTVGALVAWVVACQKDQDGKLCNRVRIYAPNKVLRQCWAKELKRHIPMLGQLGASYDRIKQGDVEKLNAGRIQVATHHTLLKNHCNNEQRAACDLMIIDEAHRAKGDGSAFNDALRNYGGHAKRKLILTATPFSIRLTELEQLLQFVGATKKDIQVSDNDGRNYDAVENYAKSLKELYKIGDGHDAVAAASRLVEAAKNAINVLKPFVIRHGINDLSDKERKHFGEVAQEQWNIPTTSATQEDFDLLLRMDRIIQLTPERKGGRRNDPRFHIGWQHLRIELQRASERANDPVALWHIEAATNALRIRCTKPHPKMVAVSDAIRPLLDTGEKVLVFCHHHATASELLDMLERSLVTKLPLVTGPPENMWRAAWESLLPNEDPLVEPIIDWLCTRGVCSQICGWIGKPASTDRELAKQISTIRPRNGKSDVPTILTAAETLTKALLDQQSTSTRAILKSIEKGKQMFGGKVSHFPGRLDQGHRVMGAWHHDGQVGLPNTLYTGKPDIVIELFNSPFGPDVLVTTDRLSEGVDLHRWCRHLIHYELDPSPVRTLQRNGRIRRVESWSSITGQPIQYAYPMFGGTRDEKAVGVMRQRIDAFGLLLGGVPPLDDAMDGNKQSFADAVLQIAREKLKSLNSQLTTP